MASFGELLQLARQFRRETQEESAKKIGIRQSNLSLYENNILEPSADFIETAANHFQLPISFFNINQTIYGTPISVNAMFRKNRTGLTKKEKNRVTAELNIRLIFLGKILDNVDVFNETNVPKLNIADFNSFDDIASAVRKHWNIPHGPIRNLTHLLENAGVIIEESDFNGAPISGVTFTTPGRPPLILVNDTHPADRLRFTLAHELGHLIMHKTMTKEKEVEMEDEANTFASSFLMPKHELEQEFNSHRKINLELLAKLKLKWRVSMQSLIIRARQLGFLTHNNERYLWQQINKNNWRVREPASLDFPVDHPTVIKSIILTHLENMGYSLNELISMSYTSENDFFDFYSRYIIKPQKNKITIKNVSGKFYTPYLKVVK